jgi:ELWxxDGT repeat protein
LWWSDGTTAGTTLVRDIYPGPASSSIANLTAVGSSVFFTVGDVANGRELWRSDGTAAGTAMVRDVTPRIISQGKGRPIIRKDETILNLTAAGSGVYFTLNDGVNGRELWRSDGTAAGTTLVRDINPGLSSSSLSNLTAAGSTLFFTGIDSTSITQTTKLWRSDGTATGTIPLRDIKPFYKSSFILTEFTAAGGTVYFTNQDDGTSGVELWRSDGTLVGTTPVRDLNPGPDSSFPQNLTDVNGTLFFTAHGADGANQLWRSDGKAGGTALVRDFAPGWTRALLSSSGLYTFDSEQVGGTVFFPASDEVHGEELWRTDGTAVGTILVRDIDPGPYGWSSPTNLTAVGSTLFFSARDGVNGGIELWRSDGTAAGTTLVRDIDPGPYAHSFPSNLTAVGTTLYFSAYDAIHGAELWRSDGTAAGTTLVRDITPGSSGSSPSNLTAVGTTLYFLVGGKLWRSDGTATGTTPAIPSSPVTALSNLMAVGTTLYFSAYDAIHGAELWRSDGTAAGTTLVRDITPGLSGSSPSNLTAVGTMLYFLANDGVNGIELWRSDGTATGTALVRDIYPGLSSSAPTGLKALGGTLFFAAADGTSGRELWRSDGTTAGTVRVADINPGPAGSNPQPLALLGSKLLLLGDDGVHGQELLIDVEAPVMAPINDRTVVEGSLLGFTAAVTNPRPGQVLLRSRSRGAGRSGDRPDDWGVPLDAHRGAGPGSLHDHRPGHRRGRGRPGRHPVVHRHRQAGRPRLDHPGLHNGQRPGPQHLRQHQPIGGGRVPPARRRATARPLRSELGPRSAPISHRGRPDALGRHRAGADPARPRPGPHRDPVREDRRAEHR